jgi:hypothetical protein
LFGAFTTKEAKNEKKTTVQKWIELRIGMK